MKRGCLFGVFLAVATNAVAQNVFVVEYNGAPQVVRAVQYDRPMIEAGGKLKSVEGVNFALRKAAVYRKGFVTLSKFVVRIEHQESGGAEMGAMIDVIGLVRTSVPLHRCFAVLELVAGAQKGIIYAGLPDLAAGEETELRLRGQPNQRLDAGGYSIHVFSDGFELLNSKMDARYVVEQTRRTEEMLLRKQPDRGVAVLAETVLPMPVYPPALLAEGVEGSAKVRCTVDAAGGIVSVVVLEATREPFGAALAAAVRQWKFEAAVVDHHYVTADLVVPYVFKRPVAAGP